MKIEINILRFLIILLSGLLNLMIFLSTAATLATKILKSGLKGLRKGKLDFWGLEYPGELWLKSRVIL